jgi:carboxymethylenebutenolidase
MSNITIQTGQVTLHSEIIRTLPFSVISGFEARPVDPKLIRGGLVLLQEIFGVNHSIQELCKHYASLGFWVIAPAFFDHVEPNLELGYEKPDFEKGLALLSQIGFDQCFSDAKQAGIDLNLKLATLTGTKIKTAVVGFCLGGSLVWALSSKTSGIFAAGSGYYGGNIVQMKNDSPKIPLILHFGEKDAHISKDAVEQIKKAQPEVPVFVYDADHGFSNTDKKEFSSVASALAEKRTLELFSKALV